MQATSMTTNDVKRRVVAIWNEFIALEYVTNKAEKGVSGRVCLRNLVAIDEMDSVGSLCVREMYEHFAECLTCSYMSREQKPLGPGTLWSYFGYLMGQARARALQIARRESVGSPMIA